MELMQLAENTTQAINGYNIDAVSTLPEDLLCAICFHPAFGGVSTTCEHIFHKDCLFRALETQRECPTCRTKFDNIGTTYVNPLGRVLSNMLAACLVHCPQGCGTDMPWEELKTHVEHDCPNTPFGCPHVGCEVDPMSRCAIETHAQVCEHAMVTCICQRQMKRKDLTDHKATVCLKELVKCGYCNECVVERGAMEAHLSKECNAAATMSLVKPLQDLVKQLTQEVQVLKQQMSALPKAKLEFRVNFPAPICDLPVDAVGSYKKQFGDGFNLWIYPKGSDSAGHVSAYVGSSNWWDARVSIQIGKHSRSTDVIFGPEEFGGIGANCVHGWDSFALQCDIEKERTMLITIAPKNDNTIVIDL